MKPYYSTSLAFVMAGLLSACSTTPQTIYQWEGYQRNVYEYFKNENTSYEKQIESLENGLQKISAAQGKVPPGYHAHLGMLYGKIGKMDAFQKQLNIEKQLFPESTQYINFLMKKDKK